MVLFLKNMSFKKTSPQKHPTRSKQRDPLAYFSQELSKEERMKILVDVGHAANIEQSRVLYGSNQS